MKLHSPHRRLCSSTGLLALGLITAAAQPSLAQAPSFQVTRNFSGFFNFGNTGFIPPDTMGAVGPTQFGEIVNGGYAVFSKTGSLISNTTDVQFWNDAGVGADAAGGVYDPRIQYDAGSGHWFATELASMTNSAGGDNELLVAVSKSADLTQGFNGYAFSTVSGTSQNYFADFDTLGINSTGVYVGINDFGPNLTYATSILAINKGSLISGNPTSNLSYNIDPNTTGFTSHPVTDTSADPTAYFLSDFNVPAGYLSVSTETGTTGPVTGGGANVAAVAYADPPNHAFLDTQKGSAAQIDGGDTRFSGSVVKVGNIIYGVQSVQDPGSGALQDIRLVGINATTKVTVLDQLIRNSTHNYNYPSLAINATGKVVIGFSSVGPNQFISGNAIVGQLNAAGNAVAFSGPVTLAAGKSTYTTTGIGDPSIRWGDYSSTTIDPTNPNKFWTIQEYASGTNVWSTKISEITLDAVPETASSVSLGLLLGLGGLMLVLRKHKVSRVSRTASGNG